MTPNESTPPIQPHYRGRDDAGRIGDSGEGYRQVNPLAVTSVVLGALSIISMLNWFFGLVPLAGIVFALVALRQIRRRPGDMTGRGFAIAGLVLSVVLGIGGLGYETLVAMHQVPAGYTELTFVDFQPDPANPNEVIPEKILALDGEFIFLRGFMYPGRRTTGIGQFLLVPTLGHCQFCRRDLKATEMIQVTTTGDVLADYTIHRIGVGGKLHIDRREAARSMGGLPYRIEADCLRQ